MKPPIPNTETARLAALKQYRILDSAPEQAYDDIIQVATYVCGTPIASITMVDEDRQWFKASQGFGVSETSRDDAICAHTILETDMLIVEDATKDQRFASYAGVAGDPHIRFYAGAPLTTHDGHAIGSLCVIDQKPRQLTQEQKKALKALARQVMHNLELRRNSLHLAEALENLQTLGGLVPICAECKGIRNDQGYWQKLESYLQTHTEAKLSHSVCPECAKKLYGKLADQVNASLEAKRKGGITKSPEAIS